VIIDKDAVTEDLLERIGLPAVIKPSRSRVLFNGHWQKGSPAYVESEEQLRTAVEAGLKTSDRLLLQERIFGPGHGVFVLFFDRKLRALFAHRRLREKPPSGGVSVLRTSVSAHPDVVAQSTALLQALDWQGVAMVEFKIDERDGLAKLMEINGRFWGSLQLAIDAGVDFPWLLHSAYSGNLPRAVTDYRTEIKLRWLLGDLDHLLIVLRHSRRRLNLPDSYPGRFRCIWEFLCDFDRGVRHEIWRRRDLRPALRELKNYIGEGLRLLGRRR
jgi:predicted ATP-grasp superfamily ATP-dependent carboligase